MDESFGKDLSNVWKKSHWKEHFPRSAWNFVLFVPPFNLWFKFFSNSFPRSNIFTIENNVVIDAFLTMLLWTDMRGRKHFVVLVVALLANSNTFCDFYWRTTERITEVPAPELGAKSEISFLSLFFQLNCVIAAFRHTIFRCGIYIAGSTLCANGFVCIEGCWLWWPSKDTSWASTFREYDFISRRTTQICNSRTTCGRRFQCWR